MLSLISDSIIRVVLNQDQFKDFCFVAFLPFIMIGHYVDRKLIYLLSHYIYTL